MAYSNGRIYVNTSVTPNVGVSIGDLQRCFAVVIKATINGQTVRRLSGDLGVIISKKTGDTFTVDGVTWQVESRAEINPWARYRPIPCNTTINNVENNKPTPITDAIRLSEQYGIDMPIDLYKPDWTAGYNDYVASVAKYGEYWLPLRPFGDTKWKRLTDFVKTNDNGQAVNNVGYDHNAKPDDVKVTLKLTGVSTDIAEQCNGTHYLQPLVPDERRWIVIPPGSTSAGRYPFPNDHLWMDYYYKKMYGVLLNDSDVTVNRSHPEWLSPIDLMGTSGYNNPNNNQNYYASVRRRLAIFKMGNNGWYLYAYVTDTTTSATGWNLRSRLYDDCPNAWVDFTDSGTPSNVYILGDGSGDTLGTLAGRLLFVECWVADNNSDHVMPIPGYTYEVNIIRSGDIQIEVDVDDTLYFWYVMMSVHNEGDTFLYDYVLEICYSPSEMGLSSVITNNTQAIAALSNYFESLSLKIGNTTVNLLQNSQSLEYVDGGWISSGEYAGLRRLECTFLSNSLENLHGQTVTITGDRVNTASIPAQIKQIVILTDEHEFNNS